MTEKKLKASFRLSQGDVLELTSVKNVVPTEETEACASNTAETLSKSQEPKKTETEEALLLRQELRIRLSAFQTYSCVNPYIQAALRLVILCVSVTLLTHIFSELFSIVNVEAEDQKKNFKTNIVIVKFCIRFLLTSIKFERRLMLVFLMSVFPLSLVCYGYLVAFFGSLYGAINRDTFEEIEKDFYEDLKNLQPGKGLKKSFWLKRMESCSVRLDSVLGYATTVPVLNFLVLFNFKTIPVLPLYYGLSLIFLLFVDEILMKKRKFEVDALFNVVQLDLMIFGVGASWIFFLR